MVKVDVIITFNDGSHETEVFDYPDGYSRSEIDTLVGESLGRKFSVSTLMYQVKEWDITRIRYE